jgi:hypothetical protein
MTVALLYAQFGSLPTCRKRLQLKKIKDVACKTSIGEQGAPIRNAVGGEIEMWLVRDNSQNFKQP